MINLRDYQETFIDGLRVALRTNQAVMGVSPTGSGKGGVLAYMAYQANLRNRKTIITVHRKELLKQTVLNIRKHVGIEPGVIAAGRSLDLTKNIQVASTDTLRNRKEILIDNGWTSDLLIQDEGHHGVSPTWKAIQEYFQSHGTKTIALTATPVRTDGSGFSGQYQAMVLGPAVRDLIERGFLSKYRTFGVPQVDTSTLKKSRSGDFTKESLQETVDKPQIHADAVATWQRHCLGMKTVVFAISPDHSRHVVEAYNKIGNDIFGRDIARHIDCYMSDSEREDTMAWFASPDGMILSNYALIGEGIDIPAIQVCQILRPTASLALHLQQMGRPLRPDALKDYAIYLDHVGNIQRHGYPDDPIEWSLDGFKRGDSNEKHCPNCAAWYEIPKPFVDPIICSCGYMILPPLAQTRNPGSEREIIVDTDTELIELTAESRYEQIFSTMRSAAEIPDEFSSKKAKANALKAFKKMHPKHISDWQEAAKALGYKSGWAHINWKQSITQRA